MVSVDKNDDDDDNVVDDAGSQDVVGLVSKVVDDGGDALDD